MSESSQREIPGNANLLIGETIASDTTVAGTKNAANQEIGVPRVDSPRWHSRGYLPHFDRLGVTQHVAFHLADSLPAEVVERIERELQNVSLDQRDVERRKKMEDWIDAGHGSCAVREPAVAAMVQDSFLFFDGERYRLCAWVVMPNHVHVLFQSVDGWTVAKIVASWKKFTARKICDYRRMAAGDDPENAPGNANLLIGDFSPPNTTGKQKNANQEIGDPRGHSTEPVWHREYWDRYMRDENHFNRAVDYIHQNPVKAGLVSRAEDWPWSSLSLGTPIS